MSKYKWDSPNEWLAAKAATYAQAGNVTELHSLLTSIIDKIDPDSVQDVFQSEMESDEYFLDQEPFDAINKFSRDQIVRALESVSIQCYDHESTEELREALRVNYSDGTLKADDIAAFSEE